MTSHSFVFLRKIENHNINQHIKIGKPVILIEYLTHHGIINAPTYSEILQGGPLTPGICLLYDYSRPYTINVTKQLLDLIRWSVMNHVRNPLTSCFQIIICSLPWRFTWFPTDEDVKGRRVGVRKFFQVGVSSAWPLATKGMATMFKK